MICNVPQILRKKFLSFLGGVVFWAFLVESKDPGNIEGDSLYPRFQLGTP